MTKFIGRILVMLLMLSMASAIFPATALPIADVTDPLIEAEEEKPVSNDEEKKTEDTTIVGDVTGTADEITDPASSVVEETDVETEDVEEAPSEEYAGGLENIVNNVSDTVVDPASSIEEIDEQVIDGAKVVEDTADQFVPEDVEVVDKVEETAEPVTSGEAVDKLVDAGGELVGGVEEEVYSVPVVGDASEQVVDSVLQGDGEAEEVVEEWESDTSDIIDATQEAANSVIAEEELEAIKDLEGSSSDVQDDLGGTANNAISKEQIIEDSVQHRNGQLNAGSLTANREQKGIPNPNLTKEEKEEIIEEAMNVLGLKEWSLDGWKYVSMDFIGRTESGHVEWERAIVYLHLPDEAGDPPEGCFQGWSATIDVNLETGAAENSGVPTESSHECASEVILQDPSIGEKMLQAFVSVFSPQTEVKPSFIIAEADDVTDNEVYGTTAHLTTPSYNDAVFDHMDKYVAHLLNQKWDTLPVQHMTQVGWLMTTIEGCADCGTGNIPKNTAVVVFTDTSVFGNLEARKVPFDWRPDESLIAETICNEDSNYLISVLYGGDIFNHNTKVSCESADNDSKISNSVFFENWNTVESASWAEDITGPVEAHSAHGFVNSRDHLVHWSSSTNEEQRCDSRRDSTSVISRSLSAGEAATWSELSKVPSAC